ncbi:unnamed protein product [Porites lobata]|uniref:Uncharacterized protein n=1 Tax=Porites lobata TaxID=104759 RepID=A0ABN8QII2_9CNID|nr:unnamed protein product [Porites lobata]
MDINSPIVELYEKENEKLVDQGALTKREIGEVQSERLPTEIEALRFELKRLNSNEEYRERAFTNLREAIKKKDGQLKDLKDELDYAQMEKNYYLYQIELLENELKDSEESKENLRFEYDELRVIFDELKEKKDCEDNFAEMEKNYYLYQIELLEKKLKDSEESTENLRFECDELRVIVDELKEKKDSEDNLAEMEKSYSLYQIELLEAKLKESKESNEVLQFECDEAREMVKDLKEMTHRINSENADYGYLREEVELLKGSLELGKNRDEGLKSQLKCLEDELAKFRNKNKQIEVIYETPTVTIYKEKGKMALELSKTSDEENVEFSELLKQIEELTEQNKYLQETLITKTQAVDEKENPETILDAKQKKFKSGIKKLKKRIRQNKREIERVGMFAWQRGCDTRDSALWMSLLKEERKELAYVRNSLKLETQTSRDKERELQNSKQRFQQKETELVQAQEGLRHVSETAGALQNVVEQIVDFLGKLDVAIKSLCRRYTQSTQSLMMKKENTLREAEAVLTDSSPTDASSRPLTWAALDAQARDLGHETSTLRYSENPSQNQSSIVSSERDMTAEGQPCPQGFSLKKWLHSMEANPGSEIRNPGLWNQMHHARNRREQVFNT